MKILSIERTALLLVLSAVFAASVIATAHNKAAETSVVGHISDSSCGLKHTSGMGDDKSCTLMCVKGGSKFVLADRDHRRVYNLDKAGQEKAREFAGQKVGDWHSQRQDHPGDSHPRKPNEKPRTGNESNYAL